jgi:hypothetical protein
MRAVGWSPIVDSPLASDICALLFSCRFYASHATIVPPHEDAFIAVGSLHGDRSFPRG